jgi:two-component system OmpR family sensor kinase
MKPAPTSLFRTLARPLFMAGGLVFVLGLLASFVVFRNEYDELLDLSLTSRAELLFPLLLMAEDREQGAAADLAARIGNAQPNPDERLVFRLLDDDGAVLSAFDAARDDLDWPPAVAEGLSTSGNYRFFTTAPDAQGRRLIAGEPLIERNEALRDSLAGIALGMGALVLIAFVIMRRAIARVQGSVVRLSSAIRDRGEANLSPIDPSTTFTEMSPAVETLNALMDRLRKAVETERNFATNAAHELRTPLAVSLAQTQRLLASTRDAEVARRGASIETGLRKLIHLVERLLQFSRAQSGLGVSEVRSEASAVIRLVLAEAKHRAPAPDALVVHQPEGAFQSAMDPDALAIALGNLIDNAFKYHSGRTPVVLDARTPGIVRIMNDCDALSPDDLREIENRFVRRSEAMHGFGIGLAIVRTICEQSGASLHIQSPIPAENRGFMATLCVPV